MNVAVALRSALVLLFTGGLVAVSVRQADLDRRLSSWEADRAAPAGPAAPDAALAREVADLRGRLDASDRERQVAASEVREDLRKVWAEILASSPGGPAGEGDRFVERPGFEDAVRAVVDRYATERRFREAVRKAAGPLVPKKPAFAELARALELRPAQSDRLSADLRAIQQELFAVLQVPRADGVVPFDEIVQAEQYPPGDPKRGEVFARLFKLTIPDSEETYFERAVSLVQRLKEGTRAYLDTAQRDTLDGLDLDWFGVRLE
jgi:hypothetical protein